jgi:hypothetical protein
MRTCRCARRTAVQSSRTMCAAGTREGPRQDPVRKDAWCSVPERRTAQQYQQYCERHLLAAVSIKPKMLWRARVADKPIMHPNFMPQVEHGRLRRQKTGSGSLGSARRSPRGSREGRRAARNPKKKKNP